MLAAARQAEVAAYVAQFADRLDENGHRLVVRNSDHAARTVAMLVVADQGQSLEWLLPLQLIVSGCAATVAEQA